MNARRIGLGIFFGTNLTILFFPHISNCYPRICNGNPWIHISICCFIQKFPCIIKIETKYYFSSSSMSKVCQMMNIFGSKRAGINFWSYCAHFYMFCKHHSESVILFKRQPCFLCLCLFKVLKNFMKTPLF